MWGAIIGGALSLASTLYGGYKASEAAQKAKGYIDQQIADNQAWYDRRYNEDATQRADAQAVLTRMQESIRQRNKAAQGRAAVTGGTEESVAQEKAINNSALAEATSRIAAAGEARKDAIESQYLQNKAGLTGQLVNVEQGRAGTIASATQTAGSTIGNAGTGVDEWLDEQHKKHVDTPLPTQEKPNF